MIIIMMKKCTTFLPPDCLVACKVVILSISLALSASYLSETQNIFHNIFQIVFFWPWVQDIWVKLTRYIYFAAAEEAQSWFHSGQMQKKFSFSFFFLHTTCFKKMAYEDLAKSLCWLFKSSFLCQLWIARIVEYSNGKLRIW